MEKLKAEIFDLIAIQDTLKVQYKKIEQKKHEKLVELQELEKKVPKKG